jgi:hypothetical protein
MRLVYLEICVALLATAVVVVAVLVACNTGTGDCPAKETIQPGTACSDDFLQCAFDLPTPSPACDGTTTVLASSCVCTKGLWVCPAPVGCPEAGAADGATDDGATDDGATDDGASADDGGADGSAATNDDGSMTDDRAVADSAPDDVRAEP